MTLRSLLAAALGALALGAPPRAQAGAVQACPAPGDLAPGLLSGSGPTLTWNVEGDGRTSVADAVAATVIATTGASVAMPSGCLPAEDPAPGLQDAPAGTFTPLGDGAWTDCDARAVARLLLGELALDADASAYPGTAATTEADVVALDAATGLPDLEFLEELTRILEGADASARGPAVLHAWTELEILGDCWELPVTGVAQGVNPPTEPSLLQRIEATMTWQVLKELVSTVVFAFVPEPIGLTIQVADPATFIAFSYVTVRKNVAQARSDGSITFEQELELQPLLAQNPYAAQRRLLEMQGRPIPEWLQAPPSCLRRCTPETCANGFDDDGDLDVDCDDSQCAGQPGCVETACADGADDDHDGFTDCADGDCFGKPACLEACTGGIDEDLDGSTDCADADCDFAPPCFESACGNGADDDGDGATDCDDADCAGTGACAESDCSNGADDDGDGFTDCDDADCQLAGACQGEQWCGCWFDTTSGNVNDWVWRCHQQGSDVFAPPYDELVSPGECQCGPEIFTVCE